MLTKIVAMNSPLVSIIIPAYCCAVWLEATVRSVIAQTLKDWEIILIDDGSKDSTAEVGRSLAAIDSRIRFHSRPNLGVTATRNEGAQMAKGRFLAFLDADDLWEPEFLELGIKALGHADLFVASARRFRVVPGDSEEIHFPDQAFWKGLPASFLRGNWIVPAMVLLKREVHETLGSFCGGGPEFWEDWDYWARAAAAGFRFEKDEHTLVHYRIAPHSRSSELELGARRSMGVIRRHRHSFGIRGSVIARHHLAGWHLYLAKLEGSNPKREIISALLTAPWRVAVWRSLFGLEKHQASPTS